MPAAPVSMALSLSSPSQTLDDIIADFVPTDKVWRQRTDENMPSWWPLLSGIASERNTKPTLDMVARYLESSSLEPASKTPHSQGTSPTRGSTASSADLQAEIAEVDMSCTPSTPSEKSALETPKRQKASEHRPKKNWPLLPNTPVKLSHNFTLLDNNDVSKEVARLNAEMKALKRKHADQILDLEAEVQAQQLAREMSESENRRISAELVRLRADREDAERRVRAAERATMDSEMQVRALTSKVAAVQRAHQSGRSSFGTSQSRRHSCPCTSDLTPERVLDDIVASLVTLELRQLDACATNEWDAAKRRLLRRWHPDKNGGNTCGGGDLATRVMQELQQRPQWTEKQLVSTLTGKSPDRTPSDCFRDAPSAREVSPSTLSPSKSEASIASASRPKSCSV